MEQSLYELIADSVVDGRLPAGFSLPAENSGEAAFADGAMDGIMLYHGAPGRQLSAEQEALVEGALREVSEGNFYDAEELVWRIADQIGPFDAHDCLRQTIAGNIDSMSPDNLGYFAVAMLTNSPSVNVVKIALSILSVFEPPDDVKDIVRTLGLSDEFTLYVAECMEAWENGNEEQFRLARNVEGWGRIHLVRLLQPETDEIRRWLLREGMRNDVMWEYSALDCWVKADVPALLTGELAPEDLRCVLDIMGALVTEGPVVGISGVEDAETHVLALLRKAKDMSLEDRDKEVISLIRDYFDEHEEIARLCDTLQ